MKGMKSMKNEIRRTESHGSSFLYLSALGGIRPTSARLTAGVFAWRDAILASVARAQMNANIVPTRFRAACGRGEGVLPCVRVRRAGQAV